MPSRAPFAGGCCLLGVRQECCVDRVADPALETAERLLVGLALGDLPLVVGAAVAVLVPDLGDRGHMDRMIEPPVSAQRQPVDLPVPRRHLDRGGAVVGGEVVPAGEPGHLPDVADHGARDHRADTEDPCGQAGAGGFHRRGQLVLGSAPLGVQVPDVGQELGGELAARPGGSAPGPDLAEDPYLCGSVSSTLAVPSIPADSCQIRAGAAA